MNRNLVRTGMIIAFLGVVVSCRPSGRSEEKAEGPALRAAVVKVARVDSGEVIRRVTFTGTVVGSRQATLIPEVAGKILEFRAGEGARVHKGDTLALLDRSLPGMTYEPYPLLAPLSGRVHWEVITPGEPVGPQRPVGVIVGEPLEVHFRVPASAQVRVGDPLEVTANGTSLSGRVIWVSTVVDPRTQTRLVRGRVEGSLDLSPGAVVKVRAVVARETGLRVPRQALLYSPTPYVVRVMDGKAHRQPVDLVLLGDRFALIADGLQAGDTVVVVGQRVVEEGQPVQVEASP